LECPGDIALATFDDLPGFDVCRPRLTAVSQPAYEMGRLGAELLIRRIEDGPDGAPEAIRLNPELKIRESTSRARRASRPAFSATS
jgi:LacI family transcriptional regulator